MAAFTAKVNAAKGVHAVWLSFTGEGDDLLKVDWFKFIRNN
ncbi:hypothetical protein [Mucilaginibacter sp.]